MIDRVALHEKLSSPFPRIYASSEDKVCAKLLFKVDTRCCSSTKCTMNFQGMRVWNHAGLLYLKNKVRTETIGEDNCSELPFLMCLLTALFWSPRDISLTSFYWSRNRHIRNSKKKRRRWEKWQPDTTIVTMLPGIWYRRITSATRRITGKKNSIKMKNLMFCSKNQNYSIRLAIVYFFTSSNKIQKYIDSDF